MKYTTKNLIAIDFLAINHSKGSFKAFEIKKIQNIKELILNNFLNEELSPNNKKILIHLHKLFLNKLKKQLLNKLINLN
tara:strand:+ start:580 stop:816 length:237 start_codon:yes stop_codon:yes gene_type:complete